MVLLMDATEIRAAIIQSLGENYDNLTEEAKRITVETCWFFWHIEYKYYLRECSVEARKAVLRAFLQAGLPLDGESPQHEAIIQQIVLVDETYRLRTGRK